VTGGGTGLGLTTATALSENGCRVYITGRRLEPLQAASREEKDGKGAIISIQADVSTKEGISSTFELGEQDDRSSSELRDEIASKEKFINVLVNSKLEHRRRRAESRPRNCSSFGYDRRVRTDARGNK
jgi:NAD(P)-dependent dehydrogenase (short-subunit alcohol dehydrogenase family)